MLPTSLLCDVYDTVCYGCVRESVVFVLGPIHEIYVANEELETVAGKIQTKYYPSTFTPPSATTTEAAPALEITLKSGSHSFLALAFPQPLLVENYYPRHIFEFIR